MLASNVVACVQVSKVRLAQIGALGFFVLAPSGVNQLERDFLLSLEEGKMFRNCGTDRVE